MVWERLGGREDWTFARIDWKGEEPAVVDDGAEADADVGDDGRVSSFPLGVVTSPVSSVDRAV